MLDSVFRRLIRWRIPIIAGILTVSALSAIYFFKNLNRADNSLPVWFAQNDPAYATYQNFAQTFGSDRFVLVAFEIPDLFSQSALQFIRDLSQSLKKIPGATRVIGLTDFPVIGGTGDSIGVQPLFGQNLPKESDLKAVRAAVLANPDLSGKIVSRNGKVALILIEVDTPHEAAASAALKDRVVQAVNAHNSAGYAYHLTGSPITDTAFNRLIIRDQLLFFPLTVALCILLSAFFFRNPWIALIPASIQAALLFWILAFQYFMGYALNVVGGLACPILVTVSVINSVHLVLAYFEARQAGLDTLKAITDSVRRLAKPCLYTTLTTLAGFLSFQPSGIQPIRALGNLTAIGTALAFLLTLFFLPLVLSLLPAPRNNLKNNLHSQKIEGALNRIAAFSLARPLWVLFVFVGLLIASAFGIARLKIETNFFDYFFKNEPVRQDLAFFDHNLFGIGSFELWITPADGVTPIALDPEILKAVDQFKTWTLRNPKTRQALSPVDFVKKINRALHENDAKFETVPATPKEISEALLIAFADENLSFEKFQTPDHLNIRLSFRTLGMSSEEGARYLHQIKTGAISRLQPLGLHIRLTGYGPLWTRLADLLFQSQITSLILSFLVVTLLMIVFLKSVRLGLISMIPNLTPILYAFGIMGFCGFKLDVATVMIAGLSLGVTVDDTIHYLARYREKLAEGLSAKEALLHANQSIGTAILFSGAILVGGFSILAFGSFKPTVTFGLLTALTLLISVICEIFLMPLVLYYLVQSNKTKNL